MLHPQALCIHPFGRIKISLYYDQIVVSFVTRSQQTWSESPFIGANMV